MNPLMQDEEGFFIGHDRCKAKTYESGAYEVESPPIREISDAVTMAKNTIGLHGIRDRSLQFLPIKFHVVDPKRVRISA